MTNDLDPLILDLCQWLAKAPRSYEDVMDAWRTSCPRLTVWEDTVERGYVRQFRQDGAWMVQLTPAGRAFLAAHSRLPAVA